MLSNIFILILTIFFTIVSYHAMRSYSIIKKPLDQDIWEATHILYNATHTKMMTIICSVLCNILTSYSLVLWLIIMYWLMPENNYKELFLSIASLMLIIRVTISSIMSLLAVEYFDYDEYWYFNNDWIQFFTKQMSAFMYIQLYTMTFSFWYMLIISM